MNAQTDFDSGAGMLRRHWRKTLAVFALVSLLIASPYLMITGYMGYDRLSEWNSRIPFESTRWKESLTVDNSATIRLRMVDDLLRTHHLIGMTQAQIVALLGRPPSTEYFRDYQFVYWLGPERGFMSIDSEWLAIRFAQDGKVVEARVLRD